MSSRSCACTCGLVCESCPPPHSKGISSLRQASALFLTAEWARCCFAICMHQEKEIGQCACTARALVAYVTKQCSIIWLYPCVIRDPVLPSMRHLQAPPEADSRALSPNLPRTFPGLPDRQAPWLRPAEPRWHRQCTQGSCMCTSHTHCCFLLQDHATRQLAC